MSQHPDDADDADRPEGTAGSAGGGAGHDAGHDAGHGTSISDEQLPEDLQPTEDNPLAQPLEGDDVKSPEELDMRGGKVPEQRESEDDGDPTATEDETPH